MRAHRVASVNPHIGKKSRKGKAVSASAAGPSAAKLPQRKPSNPHQQEVRAVQAAAAARGTSRARQQSHSAASC
eukprot:1138862-Pelagomonas_calceolata.AAC.6